MSDETATEPEEMCAHHAWYKFSLPDWGSVELKLVGATADDVDLIREWLTLVVDKLPRVLKRREANRV